MKWAFAACDSEIVTTTGIDVPVVASVRAACTSVVPAMALNTFVEIPVSVREIGVGLGPARMVGRVIAIWSITVGESAPPRTLRKMCEEVFLVTSSNDSYAHIHAPSVGKFGSICQQIELIKQTQ